MVGKLHLALRTCAFVLFCMSFTRVLLTSHAQFSHHIKLLLLLRKTNTFLCWHIGADLKYKDSYYLRNRQLIELVSRTTYFFIFKAEMPRERGRERCPMCWFNPQTAATNLGAWKELDQKWSHREPNGHF